MHPPASAAAESAPCVHMLRCPLLCVSSRNHDRHTKAERATLFQRHVKDNWYALLYSLGTYCFIRTVWKRRYHIRIQSRRAETVPAVWRKLNSTLTPVPGIAAIWACYSTTFNINTVVCRYLQVCNLSSCQVQVHNQSKCRHILCSVRNNGVLYFRGNTVVTTR
ncbi:hypothetical protein VTI28DRAFT_3874 [Corynascus sepedonium]